MDKASVSERGALAGFGCHGEHIARSHITGSRGLSLQRGSRGKAPEGGPGAKAECLLYFTCPKEATNLAHY